MIDSLGRRIDYVRLSVTDRCDLRCRYCMAETMTFEASDRLLSSDELVRLATLLVERGVRRIRLTGGEPLVRKDIAAIVGGIGALLDDGLDELTLTTNATQLTRHAGMLRGAGVRRINVSLDSRDAETFRFITRRGDLAQVLAGIDAGQAAGLAIKINMVALAGLNDREIAPMLEWCVERGFDLTLIETMPLGDIGMGRKAHYLPLDVVRDELAGSFDLSASDYATGGPARYFQVGESSIRLGLITPLTNNFCASCNRIRVTATGTVFGCLGQDQHVELRDPLRHGDGAVVEALLDRLIAGKPPRHDFQIDRTTPAQPRHMSVTGG
ncbi:GTP 3',8-cyclase MoaA [Sphingomonas sp. LY160]|uniref:GTP 3',8-cyclase MoaA n=1 Tax=Sphingomonas sp. LY160 TaxID=3095342 RepID=UPI002ADEC755|nr:GTP 3',8-cyclase MoaA [Sphingomonas sp. LY160]MEA1072278.1 GTP 3',8-cyclase MoaA [Sphingomonas sp. LY160]